jgi:hypothetical protein
VTARVAHADGEAAHPVGIFCLCVISVPQAPFMGAEGLSGIFFSVPSRQLAVAKDVSERICLRCAFRTRSLGFLAAP